MNTIYFNLDQDGSKKKKSKAGLCIYLVIAVCIVILNVLAWFSERFCNWHTKYVFPIWLNSYGRLTSLFKFSVGEILLVIGVLAVLGWLISALVALCMRRITLELKIYSKTMAWIILAVCFIMTQNCSILYHNTTFQEKYLPHYEKEYTLEELTILRDYVVEKCNTLSTELERDDDLNIIYHNDIDYIAAREMKKLGESYSELSGFYVRPKLFSFSKFFSQQSIMGYYFPFSLEANYNKLMYIANYPTSVCHELSHTKGFMREYDSNFIGFYACTNSDDIFFEYCGYLSVLNYINNDFIYAIDRDKTTYMSHVQLNELVVHDNIFLSEENWEKVEATAIIDTKTVKKVANNLMETSLKMNGVSQGRISYNQVVGLLLRYYDGVLY